LPQAIYTWYRDGSSFLHEGVRRAGYAIVSDTEVVEAQALPAHTTNQQAGLVALTHAFQLAQGNSLKIFTDSKYAFHILLSYAAIWKECGLLTTKGRLITNANQIMAMLKASHLPTAIGIVHCSSHQIDHPIVSKGNNQADEAARPVALRGQDLSHPLQDILTLQPTFPPSPTKLCPIFTNSFILTAMHCLFLSRPTYSLLLRT
jgi:ribonuclease HI